MTAVTPEGFIRTRLDERLDRLQGRMRAIFGSDINLDPDSIDGQTLGIFAETLSDLDQLAEDIYQGLNPQYATRLGLSRIVQLNGIKRIEGAFSTVDVRAIGSPGTVIPAGSVIKDESTNVLFQTEIEATIGLSGEVLVPARSSEKGPIVAPAGSLTKIDTPIYGWQSVTNPLDAKPGRAEETDEQLRQRRAFSTATPAQSVLDSIQGAIANIPQVIQARVFENEEDEVDANGLPPHSIYAVVEGGDDADVAQAIWIRKTAGTTMVGDVVEMASDALGFPHQVRFSRPADVPVYVVINLQTRAGWPTNGADRIAAALVEWARTEQQIGEEVIYSRVFSPINTVPGFSVTSLYIGTAINPMQTLNIAVPFDGLARFDTSRIVVNVSTP